LTTYKGKIESAIKALKYSTELPPDVHKTSSEMLNWVHEFIVQRLDEGHCTSEQFTRLTSKMTGHIHRNMDLAAKTQVEAVTAAITKWKEMMGPEEWKELYCVVNTIWPVNVDSPREQIMRRLMDKEHIDTRLIIASGAPDSEYSHTLLGRIIADRACARLVLTDYKHNPVTRSMVNSLSSEKDVVADSGYKAILNLDLQSEGWKDSAHRPFVERTIELALESVNNGGRPFATLIVKDGKIIAEAVDEINQTKDPLAHAEVVAIRKATKSLGEKFTGATFYILAHPCPMCLAAMYYTSPDKVVFLTTREGFARYYHEQHKYIQFNNFYKEIDKPYHQRSMPMIHLPHPQAVGVFETWAKLNHRTQTLN